MRISTQWVTNSFLRSINKNLEGLSKLQVQVSSGKQITRASENPVNNALSMQNKTELFEHTQYIKNIDRTTEWYDNTDSSLSTVENVLQRARELAVQGANDSLVQQDRDAIAKEIDQLLKLLVDTGNTDVGGEFIFSGHDVTSKPFSSITGQKPDSMTGIVTYSLGETRKDLNLLQGIDVSYAGDRSRIVSEIEKGVTIEKSVSGAEVFYRGNPISSVPSFGNRTPPINGDTALAMLNDGRGVQPGIIRVTDSNGIERTIELKTGSRLEDTIYLINQTRSFSAGILETPSDTARALGILTNAGPSSTIIGLSDPAMQSPLIPLSQLNGGMGIPGGFLSINTRDGKNRRIDISAATTVQDVIDTINNAAPNAVEAKFDFLHTRLELTDVTGGKGNFSVESRKNQLYIKDEPALTANDLGLLKNAGPNATIVSTFDPAVESEATPLSYLNGGKGVEKGFMQITGRDGSSTTVDLRGAYSIQDVIDSINTATGGLQTASFNSSSKQLIINDNTDGPNSFQIQEVNGTLPVTVKEATTVAKSLGLLKSAQGDSLIGDPVGVGLTPASLLTDLSTPPGPGFLVIRGRDGQPTEVDLNSAQTIQDVLNEINKTDKFSANWDSTNQRFVIKETLVGAPGEGIRCEEKTNTARDLGFLTNAVNVTSDQLVGGPITVKSLPTLIGSIDLNPAVDGTTELSALNSGRTFNQGVQLGRIRITDKAGRFSTIDLRECTTVQDVLDRINNPANGVYVEARINADRNGIELVDKNHGAAGWFEVIDVDSTTAGDLGISMRTIDHRLVGRDIDPAVRASTSVDLLRVNEGGVPLGKVYVQSGEFSGEIDLTGAKTVGDILDKLGNSDNRFNLSAWIDDDGRRINLTNTKGQGYIKVRDLGKNDQTAASSLGLGATRGIFTTMMDLRDSLYRNDVTAISEQSIKELSADLENVLQLHAEVGVKTNRATASKEKQENISLNINKMLDAVENIDMTEAITRMTTLETAFQAALQTGSRVMQTTLLDFLR